MKVFHARCNLKLGPQLTEKQAFFVFREADNLRKGSTTKKRMKKIFWKYF